TPRSWSAPPPDAHDALLLGSANAIRHAGPGLAAVRHLPAYAVGDATADVARASGITVIGQGQGGLQSVLGQLDPTHRRLLRLAGEERIALTPPAGVTMAERVVYASRAQPMPPELVKLLGEPALVALHSAEAAHHFAAECVRNGLRRARLRLCALGPRIAAAAGDGWGEVAVAADTSDRALLALARQMCQDPWGKTNS
ncbi:MAG: uroporphyrinogen-III synthase, partial [Novosphingobium sp.]|nr:uroporphyrinogen-III synthase [Novosphingobium sp.]